MFVGLKESRLYLKAYLMDNQIRSL